MYAKVNAAGEGFECLKKHKSKMKRRKNKKKKNEIINRWTATIIWKDKHMLYLWGKVLR